MRIILTCLALAFISTSAMAKGKSATTIEDCKSEIKSSKKEISSAKADAPATETYLRVEKTCVNALGQEDRRYYQKVILKGCEPLHHARLHGARARVHNGKIGIGQPLKSPRARQRPRSTSRASARDRRS